MIRFSWKTLLILWCFLILLVTLIPGDSLTRVRSIDLLSDFDTVVHGLLFAVLGFFASGFLNHREQQISFSRLLLICYLLGTIFGVLTEFLQFILPVHRHASLMDLSADIIGTILGPFGWLFYHRVIMKGKK